MTSVTFEGMALRPNYSSSCNVQGCGRPQSRLALCSVHAAKYLNTSEALALQENVESLRNGTASASLKWASRLNHQVHWSTNISRPYVEHFPLESLYLFHRKRLLRRFRAVGAEDDRMLCGELKALIEDFGCKENETCNGLRVLYAERCGDNRFVYNADHSIGKHVAWFIPTTALVYIGISSVALVLVFLIDVAKRGLGLYPGIPGVVGLKVAVPTYLVCNSIVLGGMLFLNRIDSVLTLAQGHRLYIDSESNTKAAQIALVVRSRFDSRAGLDLQLLGASYVSLLTIVILWLPRGDISPNEAIVSAMVAIFIFLSIFVAVLVYNMQGNAAVAMSGLPVERFKVDIRAADERFGLGGMIELIYGGLLFYVGELLLLWCVIPLNLPLPLWGLAIYLILSLPFGYVCVDLIHRLWRLKSGIFDSVRVAVNGERRQRSGLSDRNRTREGDEFNDSYRIPLLPKKYRSAFKYIVTTVVVPAALTVIDHMWPSIHKMLSAFMWY